MAGHSQTEIRLQNSLRCFPLSWTAVDASELVSSVYDGTKPKTPQSDLAAKNEIEFRPCERTLRRIKKKADSHNNDGSNINMNKNAVNQWIYLFH